MATLKTAELQSALPRISIRKGSFSANVITLTAGTGLAQAFTVVGTLILARMFTPADFGVFALFVAITSVLSVASTWRYEAAIMLPERNEEALQVQALAGLILVGMCGLSLVVVAVFRHPIARILQEDQIARWLWGLPASLFFLGVYQILSYWCTRRNQFQRLAIAGVCQSAGTFVTQIGLALAGFAGPIVLVSGWIAGQALGTSILALQTRKDYRGFGKRSFSWTQLRTAFLRYKKFPVYNTPYLFAQTLGQQAVFFILRLFASVHVIGLFSMARKAVYAPVSLLSTSMQQVFYGKAAAELKSGRLEPFVVRILKLQVLAGTPVFVVFLFEAKPICRFVLGNAWAEVGAYAAMLAFLGYVDFVTSWMVRIFDVQESQHVALLLELSRDLIILGGLAVAFVLTHNPLFSVAVYVVLDFLCSLLWIAVAFRVANFAVKSLWQVGALFVGLGAVVAPVLLAIHALLGVKQSLVFSVLLLIMMELLICVKNANASATLSTRWLF